MLVNKYKIEENYQKEVICLNRDKLKIQQINSKSSSSLSNNQFKNGTKMFTFTTESKVKLINIFKLIYFTYYFLNTKLTRKLNHSNKIGNKFERKCATYLMTILLFFCSINLSSSCDIWKASDCTGSPSVAEEEIMKSDDYTKEQLYKYCDKGKAYVDCVNAKLKCCDLKPELRGALSAYDKQLEKQAWKLGPYCAGLGESNVIKYKCRTTTKATTSTATKSTKPTMAPCQVEKVI